MYINVFNMIVRLVTINDRRDFTPEKYNSSIHLSVYIISEILLNNSLKKYMIKNWCVFARA